MIGLGLLLVMAAILVAEFSTPGFLAIGLFLIALVAYSARRWPQAAIVIVVLGPILDRYIVGGIVPSALESVTHFLSEGLLVGVGLVVVVRAWREDKLAHSLRHPVTWTIGAFVAVSLLSAAVNGVPPLVGLVGLFFTIDAVVLFFLSRMVGFTLRQALMAVGAIVGVVSLAALVALAQGLLSPYILGLAPVHGNFGEVYRLGSAFRDPNVFGALLVTSTPFVLLAATSLPSRQYRRLSLILAFLLLLALWLTFS
ncbi:MAG: hypothetical protein ABIO99_11530, partial [Candidatus Limnocylindria bacterium]